MKIGHDENYLSITPNDESDPYSGFAIMAGCGYDDSVFTGSNGTVHFDKSPEAEASFAEFEALQRNSTRINLTEGCSIQLSRQSRGDIEVAFQISRYRLGANLSGLIVVEGENSSGFLRELRLLAFR